MKRRASESCCLGIESTADDFGVGIATFDGKILANSSDSYIPQVGGIHPREAARHHAAIASKVLENALKTADLKMNDMAVIAFSQGPGLGPCLRTGATIARALASYLGVPLIGVNHSLAHIEIGRLASGVDDPLTLYVSGGNTIIAAFAFGRYRIFGETLDIALGNCLDAFAREAGFRLEKGIPLGASLEKTAREGATLIDLPYTVKGMDVSLSGLLTSACAKLAKPDCRIADLCYSFQETAFSMLAEVTERALAHTEKRDVLLTGGVASNKRLQSIVRAIAEEHDANFFVVPKGFATDNGAMIAWAGVLSYTHGARTPLEKSFVKMRWRLDEVEVPWMD